MNQRPRRDKHILLASLKSEREVPGVRNVQNFLKKLPSTWNNKVFPLHKLCSVVIYAVSQQSSSEKVVSDTWHAEKSGIIKTFRSFCTCVISSERAKEGLFCKKKKKDTNGSTGSGKINVCLPKWTFYWTALGNLKKKSLLVLPLKQVFGCVPTPITLLTNQ